MRMFFKIELVTDKQLFNADVGRIGVGICHDIRFPELAALYRAKGSPFC
jgi:predicted amidohydrolase